MSLDRYFAVFHCMRYAELVTNNRLAKVEVFTLGIWIGLLVVGSNTSRSVLAIIMLSFFWANVIFVIVVNLIIYREIRRLESSAVVAANDQHGVRKARERKTAKTVGIIVGLLLCCFLPDVPFFIITSQVSKEMGDILLWANITLILSNSSFNFFVYFWKNTEIRTAIVKLLKPITQQVNNGEPSASAGAVHGSTSGQRPHVQH